jgi:methionine-rich copper-binding protein CopC
MKIALPKNKKILLLPAIAAVLFIILILFLQNPSSNLSPQIVSTNPGNNAQNISINSEITIEFNPDLTSEDQKKISYTSSPETDSTSEWKTTHILTINPTQHLTEATSYKLNILYNQKSIGSISFTTASVENLSPEDQVTIQIEKDAEYRKSIEDDLKANPWLEKLPIETSSYVIVYDPTIKSVRVRILSTQGQTLDNYKTQLINMVRQDLKIPESIGIKFVNPTQ